MTSPRSYTKSEKAVQQRQTNAYSRQFGNFVKAIQTKLRVHLDDVGRLQEISTMIKHCLCFDQIVELYREEFDERLAATLNSEKVKLREELSEKHRESMERLQLLVEKLKQERTGKSGHTARHTMA